MKLMLFLFGIVFGVLIQSVQSKPLTFDEKKWKRIEENRKIRIETERRFEICARQCMEKCK